MSVTELLLEKLVSFLNKYVLPGWHEQINELYLEPPPVDHVRHVGGDLPGKEAVELVVQSVDVTEGVPEGVQEPPPTVGGSRVGVAVRGRFPIRARLLGKHTSLLPRQSAPHLPVRVGGVL